jgi:hypothetical protein
VQDLDGHAVGLHDSLVEALHSDAIGPRIVGSRTVVDERVPAIEFRKSSECGEDAVELVLATGSPAPGCNHGRIHEQGDVPLERAVIGFEHRVGDLKAIKEHA